MSKRKFIIVLVIFILLAGTGLTLFFTKGPYDTGEHQKYSDEYLLAEEYFSFELSDDGSYYEITGLKKAHRNDTKVDIPNSIDDIPVVRLVDYINKNFNDWKNIKIINIPQNIEYIGTDKDNLGIIRDEEKGTLGDSFITVAGAKVIQINVDVKNKVYSSDKGILYNRDKSILIRYPNSTSGDTDTFTHKIIDSVKEIYSKAFYLNTNITSVTLGANVERIDFAAFNECTNLRTINLNENLKVIDSSAFYGAGIQGIKLPSGIETVGTSAFAYCKNLSMIDIPSGKISFGKNIFSGSLLVTVYTDSDNVDYLKTVPAFKNVEVKARVGA